MRKFKKGDKVIIKSEKELIKEFGEEYYLEYPDVADNMKEYLGKETEVLSRNGIIISLLIDDQEWAWHEKWLKFSKKKILSDKLFEL